MFVTTPGIEVTFLVDNLNTAGKVVSSARQRPRAAHPAIAAAAHARDIAAMAGLLVR